MYTQNFRQIDQETYESSPRWEVLASDGNKYYHHYLEQGSWQKFREYCLENDIKIKEMTIGFRGNIIVIPPDKEGYFFRRMSRASVFNDGENTQEFFIVGYIQDGKLQVTKYKVPEMMLDEREEREIEDNRESII